MKIAITSQNRREVTGHAGMCRKFWIYDIAEDTSPSIRDRQLLELPKEQSLHEHSGNTPHPILDGVNVFITGGMGGGMRQKLARKGIQGISTLETDPDTAVRDFLNGSLVEQSSDHDCGCSGHGHHHDHDHDHGNAPSVSVSDLQFGR